MSRFNIVKNQRGDTIMEVLICVAMLGFMLGAAFSLTNKNQLSARASQERSEAVRLAEKQVEYIRTYYAKNPGVTPANANFCFDNNGVYTANGTPSAQINNDNDDTKYVTTCKDTTNGYDYKISFWRADVPETRSVLGSKGSAHVVTVRWDNIKGGGKEEVKMFYTIDQLSAGYFNDDTSDGEAWSHLPKCQNKADDDGDGKIDFDGAGVPSNKDPGCISLTDDNEADPIPATISQSSYSFPSWHLYNTGGTRHTRVFTLTNPSTSADLNLTNATITGANTNSFSIISNGCLNRTLLPGATCNLTVQFYPPSGGANNRLSNAGIKNATVTINNGSGVASTSASLSGRAYSDQAGPGDVITNSNQDFFKTYTMACYNNVEACGSPFTGVAGNGNLILGGWYCLWGGWGAGGYGNYYGDANKFIMQSDGNLVFYDPYTYRYASWTHGNPNLWLKIHNDYNYVYLTNGSDGSFVKSIYNNVNGCFAP